MLGTRPRRGRHGGTEAKPSRPELAAIAPLGELGPSDKLRRRLSSEAVEHDGLGGTNPRLGRGLARSTLDWRATTQLQLWRGRPPADVHADNHPDFLWETLAP